MLVYSSIGSRSLKKMKHSSFSTNFLANNIASPKPEKLMRWIIENATNKSDTILDPFMGSGTTGVACVQTGRNFIGIEIEPKYFEIAEKRIKEARMQLRLGI